MRIGRDVFVGLSSRTNEAGIAQLTAELEPFGYRVHRIDVLGCLHLKSACCSLGEGKILANPAWLDLAPLGEFEIINVAHDEPGAANVLRIGDTILMPASLPPYRRDPARARLQHKNHRHLGTDQGRGGRNLLQRHFRDSRKCLNCAVNSAFAISRSSRSPALSARAGSPVPPARGRAQSCFGCSRRSSSSFPSPSRSLP